MILYYSKIYDGNLDDILSKISPKGLSDINRAIDSENDVVLANAVFFCIDKLKMWKKEDIAYKIWNKLSPLYKDINYNPKIYDTYNDSYSKDCFNKLFILVWNTPFSTYKNEEGRMTLRKLALKKRSYPLKAFNNNTSIALFFILFSVLCDWIDGYIFSGYNNINVEVHSVLLSFCVSWTALAIAGSIENLYMFPIFSMIIMFGIGIYGIFFPEINNENSYNISSVLGNCIALLLVKKNIIIGISYLLWYPIIWINNDRIWDIKGNKKAVL